MTSSSFYIYFIASLPMLHFGIKPPFSLERFIDTTGQYIPEKDLNILKGSSISGEYSFQDSGNPTLNRWCEFDTALRNELVKARASRRRLDPARYIRDAGFTETYIAHIAVNAARNPSLLEAERILDEARWRALDEFAFGHYFDLDFLVVYAHKLLILERWERIGAAREGRPVEELI